MSRAKGKKAEELAVEFLRARGFKIIERNFFASKFGEIDIIAKKGEVFHFVEVKSGKSFEPIYNITPSKMQKLIRSIDYYLSQRELKDAFVVSALLIKGNEIELIENITI